MRSAACVDTQTSNEWPYCSFLYCAFRKVIMQWRGTGGREPGRIGAGGGREAGGDGAGCGSHVEAGEE